jgi:hypothetical protein
MFLMVGCYMLEGTCVAKVSCSTGDAQTCSGLNGGGGMNYYNSSYHYFILFLFYFLLQLFIYIYIFICLFAFI